MSSRLSNSFSTYVCYTPDGLYWLNLYRSFWHIFLYFCFNDLIKVWKFWIFSTVCSSDCSKKFSLILASKVKILGWKFVGNIQIILMHFWQIGSFKEIEFFFHLFKKYTRPIAEIHTNNINMFIWALTILSPFIKLSIDMICFQRILIKTEILEEWNLQSKIRSRC